MACPFPSAHTAALTLLLYSGVAIAQAPASGPAQVPRGAGPNQTVSAECRAPSSPLFTAGSMPNVASALAQRRSFRMLALGPFPSGSFGSAPGAGKYTARMKIELELALPGAIVEVEGRRLPGEITAGAPEYVRHTVMEVKPDLVVWSAGVHDAMARVEPDEFAQAVEETVEWLRSHSVDVLIVEPPYAAAVEDDQHYKAVVQALRTVADRQRVPLVLRYDAMQDISGRQSGDSQFHVHDLSRRCVPEYVARATAAALGHAALAR